MDAHYRFRGGGTIAPGVVRQPHDRPSRKICGFLLTTGDVLKITSIAALHQSACGAILLDVLLDHAGVPDKVDLAWQPKHYLGAPVPGATMATINLAHVVGAVEFVAEATVEKPDDGTSRADNEVEP
jgi:hypothetical protein